MADSLAVFRQKNAAQTQRAKANLQALGRAFIGELTYTAVRLTPGFEGFGFGTAELPSQKPGTRYIPTGRLRGGWNWTLTPIGTTSKGYKAGRNEDGPFSPYGVETEARVRDQVRGQAELAVISYLENDVAYGHDIVYGLHNHADFARDFPVGIQNNNLTIAQRAVQNWRNYL